MDLTTILASVAAVLGMSLTQAEAGFKTRGALAAAGAAAAALAAFSHSSPAHPTVAAFNRALAETMAEAPPLALAAVLAGVFAWMQLAAQEEEEEKSRRETKKKKNKTSRSTMPMESTFQSQELTPDTLAPKMTTFRAHADTQEAPGPKMTTFRNHTAPQEEEEAQNEDYGVTLAPYEELPAHTNNGSRSLGSRLRDLASPEGCAPTELLATAGGMTAADFGDFVMVSSPLGEYQQDGQQQQVPLDDNDQLLLPPKLFCPCEACQSFTQSVHGVHLTDGQHQAPPPQQQAFPQQQAAPPQQLQAQMNAAAPAAPTDSGAGGVQQRRPVERLRREVFYDAVVEEEQVTEDDDEKYRTLTTEEDLPGEEKQKAHSSNQDMRYAPPEAYVPGERGDRYGSGGSRRSRKKSPSPKIVKYKSKNKTGRWVPLKEQEKAASQSRRQEYVEDYNPPPSGPTYKYGPPAAPPGGDASLVLEAVPSNGNADGNSAWTQEKHRSGLGGSYDSSNADVGTPQEREWRRRIFNASVLVGSAASSMIVRRADLSPSDLAASFLDAFALYLDSVMRSSWYAANALHPSMVGFLAAAVYYSMSVLVPLMKGDEPSKRDKRERETLTMTTFVKKSIPMQE